MCWHRSPRSKGYSIGSAALACFLLFGALLDEFTEFAGVKFNSVDLAVPEVMVGGMLGVMMVFYFVGLSVAAVGTTAGKVVEEVRRQFDACPEILAGTRLPDYRACVSLVRDAVAAGCVVSLWRVWCCVCGVCVCLVSVCLCVCAMPYSSSVLTHTPCCCLPPGYSSGTQGDAATRCPGCRHAGGGGHGVPGRWLPHRPAAVGCGSAVLLPDDVHSDRHPHGAVP